MRELLAETAEASRFDPRTGDCRWRASKRSSRTSTPSRFGRSGGTGGIPADPAVARAAEAVRRASAAETPRLVRRRDALPGSIGSSGRPRSSSTRTARSATTPRASSRRPLEAAPPPRGGLAHAREDPGRAPRFPSETRSSSCATTATACPVLASARARVPGIVHDRSGSGQTVFVEPLDVIESNNELALLAAEERREVERLLAEFGGLVLVAGNRAARRGAELAALDALEAKVEFGEIGEGRLPEISDDGRVDARGGAPPAARPPVRGPPQPGARVGRQRRPRRGAARLRALRRIGGCWSSPDPTPAARPSC